MTDIVDDLRELNSMHIPKEFFEIGERAANEIERLREVLNECSADFMTKSSDHRIAAQEILNEFERRALVARAALKEKK